MNSQSENQNKELSIKISYYEEQLKKLETMEERLKSIGKTDKMEVLSKKLFVEEKSWFLKTPRSITALFITICILYYFCYEHPGGSTVQEIGIHYLKNMAVIICVLGVTYFPDSVIKFPHPIFWRLVYSAAFVYLLFLIFLLTLNAENARYTLTIFDTSLNKPLRYKTYGDNCDLSSKTYPYFTIAPIMESLDMYISAHFFGWFFKMMAIRNVKLALIISGLFEVCELTFKHWLPNFIECWWDHVFLDYLGCNLLGIIAAYYTMRYFNIQSFKWLNKTNDEEPNCGFLSAITPRQWRVDKWDVFDSSWDLFTVLWYVAFMLMTDLSHFFLKTILWLPITHYILAIRIFIWGFLGLVCTSEFYEYTTKGEIYKLGHNVWLSHLILVTEWLIILKFQSGMFEEPFPNSVLYSWSIVGALILGLLMYLFYKDFRKMAKVVALKSEERGKNIF